MTIGVVGKDSTDNYGKDRNLILIWRQQAWFSTPVRFLRIQAKRQR
jgi:hypothetical protein